MILMEQTDLRARLVLVERRAPRAGVMPPLQAHAGDVRYEVLAGELTLFVEEDVVRARPGDAVEVPAGAAHTFRVERAGTRWLVTAGVRSAARFEELALALAPPAEGWPSAEELAAVEAIAAANGIAILGPPGRLP